MAKLDPHLEEDFSGGRMDIGLWRRLLRFSSPYRRHVIAVVVTSLLAAVCDNLFPIMTGVTIDAAIGRSEDSAASFPLMTFALIYGGLIIGLAVTIAAFIFVAGRIATGVSHDIRKAGFQRLQELSFSYYDRRPVGWLVARLTTDCDRLARIIGWGFLDVLMAFWTVLVASVLMFYINWQLTLVMLAIVPPLTIASIYFKRRLLSTSREIRKHNSRITAAFNEGVTGIRTTRSLVRERENFREFSGVTENMFSASLANARLSALYMPVVITLGSVATALVLWVGGVRVIGGGLSVGMLIIFLSYSGHLIWPIGELARVFGDIQMAQAAAERVMDLLDTQPEVRDSAEVLEKVAAGIAAGSIAANAGTGAVGSTVKLQDEQIETIEFRNVSFAYAHGKEVLQDFNLTVGAGETIALAGPTGGGKTTIISLLCRFYEPTAGEVLINGLDYRKRPLLWLQSKLGVVLQTPHLFAGTIRENIRYGRLSASDEEVERAARLVNAHDFVMQMDKGYEGEVGESGGRLSTGQRQLISLARAVLADPQILIMDEATSSVDTRTEQLIQKAMETILEGRTSFVIAHRLSTIRSADRIVIIDGGRIVEIGDHRQLIQRRGRYFDLYTNQFTRQAEDKIIGLGGLDGATGK